MCNHRKGTSHHFKATDEKYTDERFTSSMRSIRYETDIRWHIHKVRKQFKEYLISYIRYPIQAHCHMAMRFEYTDPLVEYAREHNCAHFINCFFETVNLLGVEFEYQPAERYSFRNQTSGKAFRDVIQKILNDAIFTAKKHFSSLRKVKGLAKNDISSLTEIERAMKLLKKLIKFYYTQPLPAALSDELFHEILAINPAIKDWYSHSGEYYVRKTEKRAYGVRFILGEAAACRLFIALNKM